MVFSDMNIQYNNNNNNNNDNNNNNNNNNNNERGHQSTKRVEVIRESCLVFVMGRHLSRGQKVILSLICKEYFLKSDFHSDLSSLLFSNTPNNQINS